MIAVLQNARIVTDGQIFEGQDILVENGSIREIRPAGPVEAGETAVDLKGCYIAPGFIDLHCHGGGGDEFVDATEEAFLRICALHAQNGTRVLYPTLSSSTFEGTWKALEVAEKMIDKCPLEIPGFHLEGPYFSPLMCGAQDPSAVHEPTPEEYIPLLDRFGKLISRWSYAPEHDTECRFAKELKARGVKPAIGHSAAEYCHILPALQEGCDLVTHLYSCTSTITRHSGFRHLGVIETAYLLDEMYVEAIGDGCHLPPELLRLIHKLKGSDKVCLVTDGIRYAGLDKIDGAACENVNVPYIIEDGVAKLMDRSAFAGSIATTGILLKRVTGAGIPLADVVKMLTQTPAAVMGLENKGRIAPGYDAQFTLFDDALNILPSPEIA